MNILHMKYAVEVARLGSLNRAAETLLIAQPNISRSIKELEADLGITIFNRSSRGMSLTPEGEEFIGYARDILHRIDRVERYYRAGVRKKQHFSAAVPSAAYLTDALGAFMRDIDPGSVEVTYRETDAPHTVELVGSGTCRLGIIRYAELHDRAVKTLLEEKGIAYEMLAQFDLVLVTRADSPLARLDTVTAADLAGFTEIVRDEASLPLSQARAEYRERSDAIDRQICIDGRENRFALLENNPRTYLRTSPTAPDILARHGLCQRSCADLARPCRDMLIYRAGYKLTSVDKAFITALITARRAHFPAE